MISWIKRFISRNKTNKTLKHELATLRRWSQRAKDKSY
jgi:hypothetical protein